MFYNLVTAGARQHFFLKNAARAGDAQTAVGYMQQKLQKCVEIRQNIDATPQEKVITCIRTVAMTYS